jgi:putative spermidine/putrescine transport system permease protein
MDKARRPLGKAIIALVIIVQLLPVVAVTLNAFATDWAGTVLPQGLSLRWAGEMLADPRFREAAVNSLLLAGLSLLVSAVIVIPAVLVAHCYLPLLDRILSGLVILPYAVPGIVLALGLLRTYSGNYGIVLTGTPWVLVFGYIPLGASFYYLPIKNNLRAIAVQDLFEAGRLVGASDLTIMRRVILPSVMPGILVGLIMNFALVISEFVYANLLVGGLFPTMQILMNVLRGGSGHLTSAVVAAYFVVVAVVTLMVIALVDSRKVEP